MFNINDPQAWKLYSVRMFPDSVAQSYFGSNLMDRGDQSQTPVQLLTDLTRQKGSRIPYDPYGLDIPPEVPPVDSDDKLEVRIDQVCKPVRDDRMTSPQQVHNLREKVREALADWYGGLYDRLFMQALSGRTGAINMGEFAPNVDLVCNNAFKEPDSDHIVYGGEATSLATLDESDTLTLVKIRNLCIYADDLSGGGEGVVPLRPIKVNGGEYYVLLMHPDSAKDLRKSTDEETWQSIKDAAQKARKEAEAVGSQSPIFKNAFGLIYGKVLLHKNKWVPLFNDGGATGNVPWSRAFLLGRQALIWAFGSAQPGCQFAWREKDVDYGSKTRISPSAVFGIKRATFKGKALGMIAVDHALSKKPAGV